MFAPAQCIIMPSCMKCLGRTGRLLFYKHHGTGNLLASALHCARFSGVVFHQSKRDVSTAPEQFGGTSEASNLVEEATNGTNRKRKLFLSDWLYDLLSFADVCAQNNTISLAHNAVLTYHRETNFASVSQAVDVCNVVLHGWAKQMDYKSLQLLLNVMEREGPAPTLQSYAAAIECVARAGLSAQEIRQILATLKRKGMDVDDIFTKCKFTKDERDHVLKGIRTALPEFGPEQAEVDSDYRCSLVQELNSAPVYKSQVCYVKGLDVPDLLTLAKSQAEMESRGLMTVKSITKLELSPKSYQEWNKVLKECEAMWKTTLQDKFEKDLIDLKNSSIGVKTNPLLLHPYLSVMPVDIYVDCMIQEIEHVTCSCNYLKPRLGPENHKPLGRKIMERYFLETKKKQGILNKKNVIYNQFCAYYGTPELMSKDTPRQYWENLCSTQRDGIDIELPDQVWPDEIVMAVGQFLYKVFLSAAQIDVNILQPNSEQKFETAFYSVFSKESNIKSYESLRPNEALMQLYKLARREDLVFNFKQLPMLSPPRPWTSIHSGGFLIASSAFLRASRFHSPHSKMSHDNVENGDLLPIFDSLTQHGECPWKINEKVLDLMIDMYNKKGSINPEKLQTAISASPETDSFETKLVAAKKNKMLSIRKQKKIQLDILHKLSIANQLRKKLLWFPYNLDLHGRIYPYASHFNPIDSEIDSALLLFAKGEKLGKDGLRWLKIHLVNVSGAVKRVSLDERVRYVDENLDVVMDSADYPFEGKKWWIKSDKPWQTLAACVELTAALRSATPDDFVSHFPVHQDSSANVLQHYSALGRDVQGAELVNMLPREAPQDPYTNILELVEIERAKDAANGSGVAKFSEGLLDRSIVKQVVIGRMHAQTVSGGRAKLASILPERPDFPVELESEASVYLLQKILNALRQLFSASSDIKLWLADSAVLLSSVCNQPVEWVTPLGLPVCLPYFEIKDVGNQSETGRDVLMKEVPSVSKQRTSFPSNFIFSLESTHMMLTSLFCRRAGVTFTSHFDSFWTHPSTVATMNEICREQFVSLHSKPLLRAISECMLKSQKYGDPEARHNSDVTSFLSDIPKTGSFNIENVLKSRYFFS